MGVVGDELICVVLSYTYSYSRKCQEVESLGSISTISIRRVYGAFLPLNSNNWGNRPCCRRNSILGNSCLY